MSEFDPSQLDRLEDALEALEDPRRHDELCESLGLDDELSARFAAYRDVVAHTREALVDEPAPADALARAMAAAQAEATGVITPVGPDVAAPDPGAADVRGGWQRWWMRWRAGLIPLAALGGTAALVLWIVRPDGAPELARATTPMTEQAPARPVPLGSEAPAEAAAEAEPAEAGSSLAEDQAGADTQAPAAAPAPARASSKSSAKKSGAALPSKEENIVAPGGQYAEQPAIDSEDPKGQLYERLEQAHAQRRKGNCEGAVVRYERLLGQPDLDALQRARAEAGLGLCREFLGDPGRSGAHFGRARKQDPTIDGWISRERTKTAPAPEKKKARKAKPSQPPAQATDSL